METSYLKTLELDKYGGYVLSFNGGKVINWKTKEVIYENALSKEYIPELVDYATENKIGLITYDDDSIVVGTPVDEYIELESFINENLWKGINDKINEYFKSITLQDLVDKYQLSKEGIIYYI